MHGGLLGGRRTTVDADLTAEQILFGIHPGAFVGRHQPAGAPVAHLVVTGLLIGTVVLIERGVGLLIGQPLIEALVLTRLLPALGR